MPTRRPLLSVIIPTYKECENIENLCSALTQELAQVEYEILIIDDDSQDGIRDLVSQLHRRDKRIRLIVRKRKRSLSAAVIDGLKQARGRYCCVMDADLSHPPSAILPMLRKLESADADFCLGSRYIAGAHIDRRWTLRRRWISLFATLLSLSLVQVKDPMSGFFVVERERLPPWHKLWPLGYKIALEIMVKGDFPRIYEHPIHFGERLHGVSKMNVRVQFLFLQHLRRLYKYKFPVFAEFILFSMVGASGFAIDVLCYYGLQWLMNMGHIPARALSFWVAASWNWYLNRVVTFSEAFKSHKLRQWLSFVFVSLVGFCINWGIYALLTLTVDFFATYKFAALVLGVLAGLGTNFMFSRLFIFRVLEKED